MIKFKKKKFELKHACKSAEIHEISKNLNLEFLKISI